METVPDQGYISLGVSPDTIVVTSGSYRMFLYTVLAVLLLVLVVLLTIAIAVAVRQGSVSYDPYIRLDSLTPDLPPVTGNPPIREGSRSVEQGTRQQNRAQESFYPAGEVRLQDLDSTLVSSATYSPYLWSHEESCSALCAAKENCQGFYYQDGDCHLLEGARLALGSHVSYSPNANSNLYLRTGERPYWQDRVYIYKGKLPSRHWSRDDSDQFITLKENAMRAVPFLPTGVINDGDLVGLWSPYPITRYRLSRDESDDIIRHEPGQELRFPLHWDLGSPLYALYFWEEGELEPLQ